MHMEIGFNFACLNKKMLTKIKKIRTEKKCFPEGKEPNLSFV